MESVSEAFGFTSFRKLPVSYIVDYAALRGRDVVGFVEVKKRSNRMNKYPDIFVSLHKVNASMALKQVGMKTIFAIQWEDCLGWILLDDPDQISFSGRTDRNDTADLEPMCHFNISRVTIIKRTTK
tara:strand:- start:191 stop:568 length:378 start_codon:yes stop_codon:yes gene_type:complete